MVMLYVDDGKVVGAASPVHNPQLPHGVLVQWDDDDGAVVWHFEAPASGAYLIEMAYAVDPSEAGATGRVDVADLATGKSLRLPFTALASDGWNDYSKRLVGQVKLEKGRLYRLSVQSVQRTKNHLMCFRWVRLSPADAKPIAKGKRVFASDATYGWSGEGLDFNNTHTLQAPTAVGLKKSALVFQLHGDRANDTSGEISISLDGSAWSKVGEWTPESIDAAAEQGYFQMIPLKDVAQASPAAIQVKFTRTGGANAAEITGVAWVQN
jgi:hypothetical protein